MGVKGSERIEEKVVLFTNISVNTIFLFNLRKTTLKDGVSIYSVGVLRASFTIVKIIFIFVWHHS